MAAPLLVFDGDCGICTASAGWVGRHAPSVNVRSHHEHGVATLDKVWLIEDGHRREGAEAIAAVLRRAETRRWRALGSVLSLPVVRSIARLGYWVVARNRTRISRLLGMNACATPARGGD